MLNKNKPCVGIIMGSQSDWSVMRHCGLTLDKLAIPNESKIISAHRTPERHNKYCNEAKDRGLQAIIAGAGGAAHLAGVTAALTSLPVLGVPMESPSLKGMDSLLSTVQMPGGIPVGTFAIGKPGAVNAALFAAAIIALSDDSVREALDQWRKDQTAKVPEIPKDDI